MGSKSTPPGPIPPPVYFAAGFLAGLGVHALFPWSVPHTSWLDTAGWVLVTFAGLLAISAAVVLLHGGTSVWHHLPPRAFVVAGPYRFTRNPMYLSLAVLYVGLCILLHVAWPLPVLPLVIRSVQARFIRGEEQALLERFGDAYTSYTRRVRRWL